MKKVVLGAMAMMLLGLAADVWAGAGCCAGAPGNAAASNPWSQLDLSEEQQAKIQDLQKTCAQQGCKDWSQERCQKALAEILTPEQFAQWKETCMKSGACPAAAKAAAEDESK